MRTTLFILCALILVACGGAPNDSEKIGNEPMGVAITEALKADCPNGGVVINQGIDSNRNGKIDTDEVSSSETVCNGVDGKDGKDGVSTKIVKAYWCVGDIGTTFFGMTYLVEVYNTGDIFATGSVMGGDIEISATSMYSANAPGATLAPVLFTFDTVALPNNGYYEISMNRTLGVAVVKYTDTDMVGGGFIYTMPASSCSSKSY